MPEFPQNVLDCFDRGRLHEASDFIEAHLADEPADARAHYFATVLLHTTGRSEQAVERLQKIGLAPGIDMDFDRPSLADLERWQAASVDFAAGQRAALARAWPVTPICSLPRSGSGWFVAIFARLFDLPIGRMCFGRFPDLQAVPGWVARIAEGGATCHDHLPANDENLGVLRECNIAKVVVQVRDPRQAMVSLYHHLNLENDHGRRGLLPQLAPQHANARPIGEAADETVSALLGQVVDWIEDWLSVAASAAPPAVHFVSYEALKADPRRVFPEVFDFFAPPEEYRDLLEFVESLAHLKTPSFRAGEVDEWRRVLSPRQLALTEDLVPADLLERFDWRR